MLKSIPKSNISQKKFPVYKEWSQSNSDTPVLILENEVGEFDSDTSNQSLGIYTSPLYNSIRTKYYESAGNVFTQHGIVRNPGNFASERSWGDIVYAISIPQNKYGEQIKKGSVIFEDLDNDVVYVDDGFGNITSEQPVYKIISYDVETQVMVFINEDLTTYDVTLSTFDLNTGLGTFTYNGETSNPLYVVLQVDFQTGLIRFSQTFDLGGFSPDLARVGNVFYDDGLIVFTNSLEFSNYELSYRSVQTIYETEVLVSVDKGEFNTSQNPTAVDVSLFQSYEFETTKISNLKPAGTVTIKEVNDISKTQWYSGSYSSSISGSWNDYDEFGTSDPTGSYLAPFITTIGLYDDNYDLIAVAKLPKAIKNLPEYNVNFLIRFDT